MIHTMFTHDRLCLFPSFVSQPAIQNGVLLHGENRKKLQQRKNPNKGNTSLNNDKSDSGVNIWGDQPAEAAASDWAVGRLRLSKPSSTPRTCAPPDDNA